jgi:hypothetical protein
VSKSPVFLESDTPIAVTRRGETLGVYVPTRRKRDASADPRDLKAAADRLAQALTDVDEEGLVRTSNRCASPGNLPNTEMIVLDANHKLSSLHQSTAPM